MAMQRLWEADSDVRKIKIGGNAIAAASLAAARAGAKWRGW